MTDEAFDEVSTQLQQLAEHLQLKYDNSWFKCLRRDILAKRTHVTFLDNSFKRQRAFDNVSSRVINTTLIEAEQTQLGRHRHWATRNIFTFFSEKKTDTVNRLRQIRKHLYTYEAQRMRAHCIAPRIHTW